MLSPYRVVDLTDDGGLLCGQILGDLGADVVHVEPPGGVRARRRGPFRSDVPDPEGSLTWWAHARNQRSVVLDLDAAGDVATLRRLARTADFLIESFPPGHLARRGLGYDDLAAEHPGLVYVSITPYGSAGPKAQWVGSDLTLLAAGGPLAITGDDDRAPVRICVPQAWAHAAADAAAGALVAHHERLRSGRGQHVDASVQHSATLATQATLLSSAVGFLPPSRYAGGVRMGPLTSRLVYPARDGHVSITFLFGSAIGPATGRLMAYIHDQGGCDAATRDKDWVRFFEQLFTGEETFTEYDRVKQVVADFTATRTKAELLAAGLEHGLLVAPVSTVAEVVESPQLAARGYFQMLPDPVTGDPVRHPGPFARFGDAPMAYRRRPPRIGEHTDEVLAELPSRPVAAPAPASTPPRDVLALAGVKIVDLMWAIAGPAATRMLADFGATVVRVETGRRPDVCRTIPPFVNGQQGPENSALFHSMNAGKRMLSLDLGQPAARDVLLDLVRWADVLTESFSPKAMRAWGLDWDTLRAVNPRLIMLSTCLMGQTGPLASFAGFGNLAGAITGFYDTCGWADRPPAGPFGAYTDYISPRYNAVAVLAALEHRRRTGRGQHIDLSQGEASVHFLGPAVLDWVVNGRVWSRSGNDDREATPHGVYPAAGEDRWIAVAVESDAQWPALCETIGRPELADDARLRTAGGRRAAAADIDAAIMAWTAAREAYAAEAALQAGGVPAAVVQTSPDLCADPQLEARGHLVSLRHPELGATCVEGPRVVLSRTPGRVELDAPTLGRDNLHVLQHVLGYDEDRITALVAAGLLD